MSDFVTWQQLHYTDHLALLLRAAQRTENERLFGKIIEFLDASVAEFAPYYDVEDLRHALESQTGTTLEPFHLTPRSLELACRLIQFQLSECMGHSQVRLVSDLSIGTRGGLLIDRFLNCDYLGRFMGGDKDYCYRTDNFWAPSVPTAEHALSIAIETRVSALARQDADLPFFVDLSIGSLALLRWIEDARMASPRTTNSLRLEHYSHIGHASESLDLVGFKVVFRDFSDPARTADPQTLRLVPTTPESIILLSAQMSAGADLVLQTDKGIAGSARLRVKLALPGKTGRPLTVGIERRTPITLGEALRTDIPSLGIPESLAKAAMATLNRTTEVTTNRSIAA